MSPNLNKSGIGSKENMNENFLGLNGFIWFVGVVEDRADPLEAGRVRVRILGTHDKDRNILPTSYLLTVGAVSIAYDISRYIRHWLQSKSFS